MPISWVVNFRLAAGLVRSERAFSREEVEVWLELLFEASQPLTLLVIAAPDGSFGMFSFELKPWLEQYWKYCWNCNHPLEPNEEYCSWCKAKQ